MYRYINYAVYIKTDSFKTFQFGKRIHSEPSSFWYSLLKNIVKYNILWLTSLKRESTPVGECRKFNVHLTNRMVSGTVEIKLTDVTVNGIFKIRDCCGIDYEVCLLGLTFQKSAVLNQIIIANTWPVGCM